MGISFIISKIQMTKELEEKLKKIVHSNMKRAGIRNVRDENMFIFKTRDEAESKLDSRKSQMIVEEEGYYILVLLTAERF